MVSEQHMYQPYTHIQSKAHMTPNAMASSSLQLVWIDKVVLFHHMMFSLRSVRILSVNGTQCVNTMHSPFMSLNTAGC